MQGVNIMTLLKPSEVAKILRVSLPTTRKLITEGDIPSIEIGRQYRVDLSDLTKYLAAKQDKKNTNETSNI